MSYARMGPGSDVYVLRMAGTPYIACYGCNARGRTYYMLLPERVLRHLHEEHLANGQPVPQDAIARLEREIQHRMPFEEC
jgi:hypothetical protein